MGRKPNNTGSNAVGKASLLVDAKWPISSNLLNEHELQINFQSNITVY